MPVNCMVEGGVGGFVVGGSPVPDMLLRLLAELGRRVCGVWDCITYNKQQAAIQLHGQSHYEEISLYRAHICIQYTCNKADDHPQVPVLNCNNYRVIGITRLG